MTAQSAWSCISTESFFGRRAERSMPTSAIASTTAGQTPSRRGSLPADSARTSAGASRSKKAWAIWERPALWVQMNRTYFTG